MAKKGRPAENLDEGKPPAPPADAFVTLMLLSVAALATGVALLAMTLSSYGWAVRPAP